jgi:hypothetical protein
MYNSYSHLFKKKYFLIRITTAISVQTGSDLNSVSDPYSFDTDLDTDPDQKMKNI